MKKRYIIGIDPATGSSSACGLALYDTLENKVIETVAIWAEKGRNKPTHHRIKSVATQVARYVEEVDNRLGRANNLQVNIEWFIMRGLGGQTLQRVIGAIMSNICYSIPIKEVHNIGTKKNLTGSSVVSKVEMGEALLERLDISNYEFIQTLLKEGRYDEIDAIAIALNTEYRK